jgi:hypothetical protein
MERAIGVNEGLTLDLVRLPDWLRRLGRTLMAITQAVCGSFKQEILVATHNFTASTGDVFKLALYTSSATMDETTTAYASTNEVGASGTYSAGGGSLTNITPVQNGSLPIAACCSFSTLQFTGATITARGALIYNSSKSNKAVVVLNFGSDQTSTAGNFTITFPAQTKGNAIVQLA